MDCLKQGLLDSLYGKMDKISIQFSIQFIFLFGELKDKDSYIKHLNIPNTR